MKVQWRKLLLKAFVLLFVLTFTLPAGFASASTGSFYNVLVQNGADPSVIKASDGYYYSTYTTGGDVRLWRSKTLTGMDAGDVITLWSGCCGVWAPEIVQYNGGWYIYFAKDDGNNATHRMYVVYNTNPDPFSGTWSSPIKVYDSSDQWAIDGTVLNNNGSLYFIWSGWDSPNNTDQNLYIAPMDSPTHISGSRVKIASPVYAWETNTTPRVNEGPEVIIRGSTINLVYSASGSWTDSYCLGLITASTTSNLLSASAWTKKNTPVFQSGNGIYGPGHHSFTKSKDGTEDWIVYHSARWQGSGWERSIRAQKFTWNADNTPNLGTPKAPNTPIPLPSGEPGHDRYEAEKALLGGNARLINHPNASGGVKAGYIDTVNDYVQFTVNVGSDGWYNLIARTDNGTSGKPWATLKLSVNGGAASDFHITYSGWDHWTNASARVFLNRGNNTLRFTHGSNYAEVDCIDIFSDAASSDANIVSGAIYKLMNPNSNKALDVNGGGTANGTNVQIWSDNNSTAQEWRITKLSGGNYKLINTNSNKALDISGAGTASGTNVQIWDDIGSIAQEWMIIVNGDGTYKLINPNSKKALDIQGGGTANGSNVWIWDDTGNFAQKWNLIKK
ncbi:family 43 glycosylhydrolase [Paenibacillus sedimenti]|uniref:Family 43 glycosylhydrolase n=1 Tax=Paenibacillus sedimenti TaxID=2770274 RepID=A0A926KLZ9_9BACL|nr:family 43 glycosylhydrolase [Paenibacillus sedimenti]MBD0379471.1 family 43 glycosylhydrolase [Paenibacillus sedimenti]